MEVKIETVVSCFMTVCNLVGGYQHVSKHQPHYMVTLNLKTIVYRVLRERWGKFWNIHSKEMWNLYRLLLVLLGLWKWGLEGGKMKHNMCVETIWKKTT